MACLFHARGTNKIASTLSIASSTVKTHINHIKLKLETISRESSSRESILDFIEQSSKADVMKFYYKHLIQYTAFEKTLIAIAKLHSTSPSCLILAWKDGCPEDPRVYQLRDHLKLAGIEAEIQYQPLRGTEGVDPRNVSVVVVEKETGMSPLQEQDNVTVIDLILQTHYYLSVLNIIKKALSPLDVEKLISEFERKYMRGKDPLPPLKAQVDSEVRDILGENAISNHSKQRRILQNRGWVMALSLFIMCALGIGIVVFQKTGESRSSISIRSDLMIPKEAVLLLRPSLMNQMDCKLGGKGGIQILALVGMGGVGKTILARQYAREQKASVIWEINAQAPDTIKVSLETLAEALALTQEDKKTLKEIKGIQTPSDREGKMLQFIKEHLALHANWILIFDNVDKIADIGPYFPYNARAWGDGKVILTSRNSNIQTHQQVTDFIPVSPLTPAEKYTLFRKIMGPPFPLPSQDTETKRFLEAVPPFPLDVSMAAYYVKTTHTLYSQYVESLQKSSRNFVHLQELLLKESGPYLTTRYSIIALSLDRLLQTHKDFADLLLCIGLLDSQGIPREFLDEYKDKEIVATFIYHLKKYSLIMDRPHVSGPSSLKQTLSFHRSTQAILLLYLTKKLHLNKNHPLMTSVSSAIERYTTKVITQENSPQMTSFIPHLKAYLSHHDLLNDHNKGAIETGLGCLYYYTHYHYDAKKTLERSVKALRYCKDRKSYKKLALALAYLGNVNKEIGNLEQAKTLLEESVTLYKKYDPQNHIELTRALAYLGDVYKNLGDYERAKGVSEEDIALSKQYARDNPLGLARALEYGGILYRDLEDYERSISSLKESLALFQKYSPENYVSISRVLKYLANTYRNLGRYAEAKDLLTQSLAICETYLPENQVSLGRTLVHLATIYKNLGDYTTAKTLLDRSLKIHNKLFGADNIRTAWVVTSLGNLYREMGNYDKARSLIEQSLPLYRKAYGDQNLRTAWVFLQLGYVYEDLQDYPRARDLIKKGLAVHRDHFPEDSRKIAVILFHLGNVHRGLGHNDTARLCLQKSLKVYRKLYGNDHIETGRILRSLAKVSLAEKDFEESERLLKKAFIIFQHHPDIFLLYEDFGALHYQKALSEYAKGHTRQAQTLQAQAIEDRTQALKRAATHFPKGSMHIKRVQRTLQESQAPLDASDASPPHKEEGMKLPLLTSWKMKKKSSIL